MKLKVLFVLLAFYFIAASCVTQRVQIGDFDNSLLKTSLYKKEKDIYLFWDQVKLRSTEKYLDVKAYELVKRRTFFDAIIFYGTAGIFSFYTLSIRVPKPDETTVTPR
ncbi:MAG: hypothetical protein AB7E36_06715 [Salinivirgaceae bacterium]